MENNQPNSKAIPKDNDTKNIKLGTVGIIIIIVATLILVFSFFAPSLFIQKSNRFDFSSSGQIGDTIGGIMNPFIAIGAALLTFLAFYIQYKANRLQFNSFREELDEQKNQFEKNQFENQFYEMLKLHQANVSEINVISIIHKNFARLGHLTIEEVEEPVKGRAAFPLLLKEFEICYYIAKSIYHESTYEVWINEAYGTFFQGIHEVEIDVHKYYKTVSSIRAEYKSRKYRNLAAILENKIGHKNDKDYNIEFKILNGHSSQLAHYYRHLFQTVKFIANQDENFIPYNKKRNYLRILRAQLSNEEQALLFYNWLSKYGGQWENENNKYFTDYRMIHNIYQSLIVEDIQIEELFKNPLRKENGREKDPMFEYQDWEN